MYYLTKYDTINLFYRAKVTRSIIHEKGDAITGGVVGDNSSVERMRDRIV